MNAQQAIEILKQVPGNTEVMLWLGASAPAPQPIPSWPTMPQPNIQYPWQPPYVITCKHETQTH